MEDPDDVHVAQDPVYDVYLTSSPPESVRRRFPTMAVCAVGAQTALRREVSGPAELDDLLDTLGELRIPLVDVHLLPARPEARSTYEVHVDGEVGESLLRHLRWSSHVVPGHARVRILAAARELQEFLLACTESGASIERVRLVTTAGRSRIALR
jgi:hypothetical protein